MVAVLMTAVSGCGIKKHREVKQESPMIKGEIESDYQELERLLFEPHDEAETYKMLRALASTLHRIEQMLNRTEKGLEDAELLKAVDIISIGEPERANIRKLKQQTEDLNRETKEMYSKLAILYNKKMTKVNFKFTKPAGLPQGETETLPRIFPIR
ncbi:MAG: hypothetical protein HY481_00770 [Candidatus Vogelbacteria bacterium]|nr:hypothetical protein [Candidatus Vogelbacteria bacterium]